MARLYHLRLPHPRAERPSPPAALVLILVLAAIAAVWLQVPPVASLLPIHPPG